MTTDNETPGDRLEREKWEPVIARKESALRVLEPLGFVDNRDDEFPGTIFHSGANVALDTADLSPSDVVYELLKIGSERGVAALRRDLRAAIGL
jgi:hypothetical protein